MSQMIVVGLQWGDEGKGKIVDLLSPAFDVVARFQGGHNAGHTVRFGERHLTLHLLPSGIVRPQVSCVLGNGMVIAPDALREEIEGLERQGIEVGERLFVSARAHVILPTHVLLDRAREEARGEARIGTTLRGIGPAYEMKAGRCGVRIADLDSDDLIELLRAQHQRIAPELANLGAEPPPKPSALLAACRQQAEWLAPWTCDVAVLLDRWQGEGKRILFEGAQGALLDLDFGTYPYVTSSATTAGGVAVGAGVPPRRIDGVLGVVKAYATRVGGGPFPTELDDGDDGIGEHLRRRGNERGTTTGRPRRCGWFDAVAARYARLLSGVDLLALTKLDVLDELDEIRVCVAYRAGGREIQELPAAAAELARLEPVYETLPGWRQDTRGALQLADLPAAARSYVVFLEQAVGAPVALISSGPRREETILLDHPELKRLLGDRYAAVRAHRDGP
ncbi:MAG: adenylosuccinate synthase [Acidobacteria bacterium]|nr:MAG: adenylosuccinate synthase [Acidobacteriota bacterium]